MNSLPRQKELPSGLTLEGTATSLAALTFDAGIKSALNRISRQLDSREAFAPLAEFGIYPVQQVLFYGPPGNGKTSACQWIAKQRGVPLYRVRCEQLVSSYIGATAKNITTILDFLETKEESVVLFDEFESIFPSRNATGNEVAGRELSSAMAAFWQRLDRWSTPQVFVMATNLVDRLDAALLSRIEIKLEFGPPTSDQCKAVVAYWQESLHEHGGHQWGPALIDSIDNGQSTFTSFRELWLTIKRLTLDHVSSTI